MIPRNAIVLAKSFEGFSSTPYLCPAGFWTIGYGHLCKKDHSKITEEQGETYLSDDLTKAYYATIRLCPVLLTEDEKRLGAIVDFAFNLGSGRLQQSTLRRMINQKRWVEASYQLQRWVYGGGKKLPGLIRRRKAESLFLI
jgi:lysozyme